MFIVVKLSDVEVLVCRMIGNMRSISSRANKVGDRKMGWQPGYAIDEDGTIGEYAFCKHFNIFFDPSVSVRSGSYDCLYKGKRIDVKTTRYKEGELIATTKVNPDVDIFVLAILDEENSTVTFTGYALASELYKESTLKNFGWGNGHAIKQEDLRQWKQDHST